MTKEHSLNDVNWIYVKASCYTLYGRGQGSVCIGLINFPRKTLFSPSLTFVESFGE